jgi:hypothetical protein
LLESKIFNISSTSVSVMIICRSPSVCNSVRSGGMWSLSSSVDCSLKNLLNNSDLSMHEAAPILKYQLCKLFNISLSLSSLPSEWKLANVTPVFKKDSPGILKNYRPISLIRIVGEVMERCLYKHIYNFLSENRIISSNQSGFTLVTLRSINFYI